MELKDLLIAYQGGGYDGCFWEWNFFSFDKDGVFHNIYTSGRMGIKTKEEAREMIKDPDNLDSGVYIYDIATTEGIEDFQDSHAVPAVVKIVDLLNQGEKFGKYSRTLYFICDECEDKITGDGRMEDWHGCGGIEMTADTKLCEDCYMAGVCSECGEYVTKEEIIHDCMCNDCYNSKAEEALEQLSLENYVLLEYNRMSNTMSAVEDIELCDIIDDIKEGNLWDVEVHCKDGFKHYLIEASSQYVAIDDVTWFINREYYTASAEQLTLNALVDAA
jgi:hypothetical protein